MPTTIFGRQPEGEGVERADVSRVPQKSRSQAAAPAGAQSRFAAPVRPASQNPDAARGRSGASPGTEFVAADLAAYEIETLWQDGELTMARRVPRAGDERPPLLTLGSELEQLGPASRARLERIWAMRDVLESSWATRPLALLEQHGRPLLVLEHPAGTLLSRLVGEPWEVTSFLRVAIGLATALARLHALGLVHKDVKPANLMVSPSTGAAWLTGFGLASALPRERQAPTPPQTIAGTLAYMAPEQTGRMNRSIDSRSDLYALGITFYEMLTGALPFVASDPLEWVHCHIARQPEPPGARVALPAPLSAIVLKLIAKNAEERYQTAAGLAADLRRCLTQRQSHEQSAAFGLGEHDVPDRLLLPERLYGREAETDALVAAAARVAAQGVPELVLVSGYSGIGKTSVVHELHRALVPSRGLFAAGKFDQYKRDIPYATLAQAFQTLIRQILATSEAEVVVWRDALRAALGANAQLIVNLIPELEFVIGPQPPVAELPPRDAQSRFQLVLRRFLAVFARPEHPLALFLDDLQWIDAATLELLERLVSEPEVSHLLVIGAYRDNEVDASHPLARTLEAIRKGGARLLEIVLAPLGRDDVARLLGDALRCGAERVRALAGLVHDKTGGNPFFAIQFVGALSDESLLVFDRDAAAWRWDLDRIRAKRFTDNVVDLMTGKLSRLPAPAQAALQDLACLGNAAEVATLALVHGSSADAIDAVLWDAVQAGLVLWQQGVYAFPHDRVQEAAYALIPDDQRAPTHLRIGRMLAARTAADALEESIFEIVNQLDRGAALIDDPAERARVAELNLIAGKRAKAATAYASALAYLRAGRALLADDSWQHQYALAFALEFNLAECAFLTGDFAGAEERLTLLSQRAVSVVDRGAVAWLHVTLSTTLDRSDRAIEICLAYLHQVGVDWSPHPTEQEVRAEYDRIWRQLGGRSIEELIDLPVMTNPVARATLDVLTAAQPPALFTDENLLRLVVGRMANLSLEYGNGDGSCFAWVHLSMILSSRFGDYRAAARFGRLGVDLVETRGFDRFRARVFLSFANVVTPWMLPVREGLEWLRRAFAAAQETGDLTFGAYARNTSIVFLLVAGAPLGEVEREAEDALAFVQKSGFGLVADMIAGPLALVRTLRGRTADFGAFDSTDFDAAAFERHLDASPHLAIVKCRFCIRKLQARFLAGAFPAALEAAEMAEELLWTSLSFLESAEYHFYAALTRAAHSDALAPADRPRHLTALQAHHRQLAVWAESCPANFASRTALVAAEIARVDGRELDAERLYEDAVAGAREQGCLPDEALAHEMAAAFHTARRLTTIAHAHLRNARRCYASWGATAKVRQLEQLHPQLRDEPALLEPTSTIAAPVAQLDLATVLRVSQAVSSEIELDKLIDTLLVIALEHAGASRGVLLLARGAELHIEAEATTSGNTVDVELGETPVTPERLPESVLRYVTRTHTNVLLDDAQRSSPFAADPYVRRTLVRSVLCLPLLKQAELIGVLHLENDLAPNVFTPARIEVLQLLASQAAVSLDNARVYGDLRHAEQTVRRAEGDLRVAIDTIPGMVWTLRPDGVIDFLNMRWVEFLGAASLEDALREYPGSVHPDDLEDAVQDLFEHLASGEPFEREVRVRRYDGEYRWLMTRAVPLHDETGTIVRWYGATTDIHDRKEAQEIAGEREHELRTLIDVVPQQIFMLRADLSMEYANGPILDYHGAGLADALFEMDLERRDSVLHHPDDLPYLQEEGRRALVQGVAMEVEGRLLGADGEYRWFLIRMNPLRDEQGRIVRWYGTRTDIHDRKIAEQRLQQEERELRQLVDFIPQKIAVLDPEGRFLHANRTLLAYLYIARPLEEFLAAPDIRTTVYHSEDLGRVYDRIRALGQGTPGEVEARMRRHDGVYRWHLIRYEPLRDEDGHITRWYATATDIEERKVAEERMQEENLALREEVDKASMFEEIVGVSAPLRTVLASVAKVAPTESTVLITGETGTGKELVARAIHKRSRRAARAFVSVNCAAIPAPLIASELFGHEKGAFTGAVQRRLGRFELADGGTIFLDEIGDLPPDTQLALLRVLQEREFERVGGTRPIKVDVRVITATNRDLEAAMADGSFRDDLFYRLDVFPIALPSLRERKRDIPLLVAYFVERFASRAGKTIRRIDRRTLEMLEGYHWPGNIRELQNVVERSVIVCDTDTLTVDESWLSRGGRVTQLPGPTLNEEIVGRERQMIETALAESRGRVSGPFGAAVKLGIPASTLDSKIRALRIDKHRFKSG